MGRGMDMSSERVKNEKQVICLYTRPGIGVQKSAYLQGSCVYCTPNEQEGLLGVSSV